MTALTDPTLIYDVAYGLLVAAEGALVAADADPIARAFVAPGNYLQASWDDCCGGQLICAMGSVQAMSPFPIVQQVPAPCGVTSWGATFYLQIARCHQSVDENSNDTEVPMAPESAYLGGVAAQTLTDAWVMTRGVSCYLAGILDSDDFLVADLTPNGPNGNCVAYDLRVLVNLGEGCLCPA